MGQKNKPKCQKHIFFVGKVFLYPFSVFLAELMGTPLSDFLKLLAISDCLSVFCPILGHLSDVYSGKKLLILSGTLITSALVIAGASTSYWFCFVAFAALNLGYTAFSGGIPVRFI